MDSDPWPPPAQDDARLPRLPPLAARFAARVARTPLAPAVVSGAQRLTYAALAARADALAAAIFAAGESDFAPVALDVPAGVPRAIATLAVLTLGRICVPLDRPMPAPRRDAVLADAGATLVVGIADLPEGGMATGDAPAFSVTRIADASPAPIAPPGVAASDLPAMILYTSGSTGAPKGVVYTHRAIVERIVDADRFAIGEGDRIGVFGTAGMNLFRALLRGATLVSWDVTELGLAGIGDWIAQEQITLLHCIPTLFRRWIATAAPQAWPRLRCVNLTGEAVVQSDVLAFRRVFPAHCTLVNGFGTTETGTFCQFVIDGASRIEEGMVPVGHAVDGVSVHIVDAAGVPVAPGDTGDIVVEGALLGAGYWRRALDDAQRFTGSGHTRRYATGDIGRQRADGALLHLGRRDVQFKVRGMRVEAAEVEAALRAHPEVRDAAVIGAPAAAGETRLVACVATATRTPQLASELARFVRARLPGPMVPDGWTFVDALPQTPNGKVDRRALPLPPPRSDDAITPGIVERFLDAATRCGDRVAFDDAFGTLSFAALERRSRLLAAQLRAQGVGNDDVVALALPRGLDYAVGLMAILRSGAACMPVDVTGPSERNAAMLRASGARAIVDSGAPAADWDPSLLRFDSTAATGRSADDVPAEPVPAFDASRMAFVICTSGSTGVPKAVEVTEGEVLHRLGWDWAARPFAGHEVACQRGTPGFVDTIAEWLGALLCGVPTFIVADALLLDPRALVAALAKARVSRILLVPSQLDVLLDACSDVARELPLLRLWTLSGESLRGRTVERFREAAPSAALWNVYGATEAWDATCHEVREAEASVPIGRPLPGMRCYVLDERMEPVATGTPGDLYVAGNGLARGYRGDATLTLERFVANPFCPGADDRLYRTGDRARMRDDGLLECLGRADRRIKINGVRIELGEVEAAIAAHADVREAAVVHVEGRIVAHVALAAGASLDRAGLIAHARARLPGAAVPHAWVEVASLPRNARGKVARSSLVSPTRVVEAPHSALEQMLVDLFVDVLGRKAIGVTDDFFDQGGDSLLAVRLASAIEAKTGFTVPLHVLAAAGTPRALAAGIGRRWSEWTGSRIAIHAEGSTPPLFAIAGAWGYAMRLLAVGRRLGSHVPFHALQPPMMQWPEGATLQAMAAHYVDEMLGVCPGGPRWIFGTSFGGIMAFEVAQQLVARNFAAPMLLMVDSQPAGSTLSPAPPPAHPLGPAEVTGRRIYLAHIAAANSYVPAAAYAGPVVYFRCAHTRRATLRQWQRLIERPMEVVPVPGVHGEYHQPPQLGVIVQHVRAVLSRQGAGDATSTTTHAHVAWQPAQSTRPPADGRAVES